MSRSSKAKSGATPEVPRQKFHSGAKVHLETSGPARKFLEPLCVTIFDFDGPT
jgi:hypothetical protein